MTTADIPRVRIIEPNGHVYAEGFYFEMPESAPYPMVRPGEKPDPIPTLHCVVTYNPGDWGMANTPRIIIVTPPHRIEVIEEEQHHG